MYENGLNFSIGGSVDRKRQRRVVFYGRVSTEHEAQLAALENQMKWYDDQANYKRSSFIAGYATPLEFSVLFT